MKAFRLEKTGVMIRAGLFLSMALLLGCKSVPEEPACANKDRPCPLGTQKQCSKDSSPCQCHCGSMNSHPYSPQQMQDQNRIGFPKEEKPYNSELEGPFSN